MKTGERQLVRRPLTAFIVISRGWRAEIGDARGIMRMEKCRRRMRKKEGRFCRVAPQRGPRSVLATPY